MKKRIFISLFVGFFGIVFSQQKNQVPYYCSVVLPLSVTENKDTFIASYKGGWYTATADTSVALPLKSLFEMYEDADLKSIHIFVTEQPKIPASLDVKWQTSAEHPYRRFLCEPKQAESAAVVDLKTTGSFVSALLDKASPSLCEWDVRELDNNDPVVDIPDNAFIFFFDPAVIEIKPSFFDQKSPFRTLPTIVIKDQLSVIEFKERVNKMACMSIDCKPFNKRPEKFVLPPASNTTTIVSLPAPKNRYIGARA